jgi:hypothetical protein
MLLVMVSPFCTLAVCRMFVVNQRTSRRGSVTADFEVVLIVARILWILMMVSTALIPRMRGDEVLVVSLADPVEVEGEDVLMHRPWVRAYRTENPGMAVVESSLPISVERLYHLVGQEC